MYHPRCVETIGCWIPLTLHATIVDDTRLLELALRKLLTTNAKPFFLNVLNNFQGRIAFRLDWLKKPGLECYYFYPFYSLEGFFQGSIYPLMGFECVLCSFISGLGIILISHCIPSSLFLAVPGVLYPSFLPPPNRNYTWNIFSRIMVVADMFVRVTTKYVLKACSFEIMRYTSWSTKVFCWW